MKPNLLPFIKQAAKQSEEKLESKAERAKEKKNPALEKGEIKKTGTYKGKSNALGHGGRAQQMKDRGVPGGVIGNIARREGAAPGGPNFHGKKKGGK